VQEPEYFWDAVWEYCSVMANHRGERVVVHFDRMPGARWYPDARINSARNLLWCNNNEPAVIGLLGWLAPGPELRGGPTDLIIGMAAFAFDHNAGCFTLVSVHPGHTVAAVVANTGFTFQQSATLEQTPEPRPETLQLLRGPVREQLAETYQDFATNHLGRT